MVPQPDELQHPPTPQNEAAFIYFVYSQISPYLYFTLFLIYSSDSQQLVVQHYCYY